MVHHDQLLLEAEVLYTHDPKLGQESRLQVFEYMSLSFNLKTGDHANGRKKLWTRTRIDALALVNHWNGGSAPQTGMLHSYYLLTDQPALALAAV